MRTQLLKAYKSMRYVPPSNNEHSLAIGKALRLLESCRVYGARDGEITSITCDSRKVAPGACFVAINGEIADGHAFVSDAASAGAKLFVVERAVAVPRDATMVVVRNTRKAAAVLAGAFYGNPSEALDVIGVTGTHGKTIVTYMVRHIAEFAGRRAGMLTTVSYDSGRRTLPAPQTTPDPIQLNRLLAEALDCGVQVMPMEVSSHSLCQHRVAGLKFRGAVFTNLASDHLDYHKTHDAYREAKAKLFEKLTPDAFCALNADDANWRYYADRTLARVLTCSTRKKADLRARIKSADLDAIEFDLICRGWSYPVKLHLPGTHNVENALAAGASAVSLGIEAQEVAAALSTFAGVPGRLERIETGNGFAVFVDYAHTAGALATVLSSIKPFVRRKLIAVFGAGGDRDRGKRPRMAQAASRFADLSVLTSDNPRSEDPAQIIAEVQAGFGRADIYLVRPDRREAIETALDIAGSGDVVVIAGKGHEDYQIFADRVEHFDDREVVREALSKS